jgi:hypothetical protein
MLLIIQKYFIITEIQISSFIALNQYNVIIIIANTVTSCFRWVYSSDGVSSTHIKFAIPLFQPHFTKQTTNITHHRNYINVTICAHRSNRTCSQGCNTAWTEQLPVTSNLASHNANFYKLVLLHNGRKSHFWIAL